MKKLAVIFPGVGYTKDRPLLYYSGKMAAGYGFELRFLDFSGIKWSKEELKDPVFLNNTLERCLEITDTSFKDMDDLSGYELYFISKSIGTVVATAYAKKHALKAGQICFSPLTAIESYVTDKDTMLFYGDNDPMADHEIIEKIMDEKGLKGMRINGGNHSLETGDIGRDIDNLKDMMECIEKIMGKGNKV